MHSASAVRTSREPRGARDGESATAGVRAPALLPAGEVHLLLPAWEARLLLLAGELQSLEAELPADSPPGVCRLRIPLVPLASDFCDSTSPEPGASLLVEDSAGSPALTSDGFDLSE